MSITEIKVRNVATRQRRYLAGGRRGYVSLAVLGTVCETNVIRHVGQSEHARAPGNWENIHGAIDARVEAIIKAAR